MKKIIYLLYAIAAIACTPSKHKEVLRPSESYLAFSIDEDTRLPEFCIWTFEENGKEYLAFPNLSKEILFYDIVSGELVQKVKYVQEGNEGVGYVYGFGVKDFQNIYLASSMLPIIYVTDSTGKVKSKMEYYQADDGTQLTPALVHTITYSPMFFLGDSLYLPQTLYPRLGDRSPLGVMIDLKTEAKVVTPLTYKLSVGDMKENSLQLTTGGAKVSVCYNGKSFVYSPETNDSIYELSKDFKMIRSYCAKSRYINEIVVDPVSSNMDVEKLLKRICELPAYGNMLYDKYRNVYYRFVFPKVELEQENSYLDIYHNGRKQFAIMVLDENMNVLGETLFPEYTYNANLLFINKDGLYLSTSHFKRSDFDEDVLRFQKIELKEKNDI